MVSRQTLVAVVDDDRAVRRALKRVLTASGLAVETFDSGRAFLSAVNGHRPDCILLDVRMPDLTAVDVLRQLRSIGIRIPTVVITGHDDNEAYTQCVAIGVAAYLWKPLDERTLLNAIADAIGDATIAG